MLKVILFIVGTVSLVLGVAGIFLPVLPTTPFVLLSALCYAKSSERFHKMLLNNRYMGKLIRDFETKKGISLKAKVKSIGLMWLMLVVSIFFFVDMTATKIVLVLIGAGVTAYILSLNTVAEED